MKKEYIDEKKLQEVIEMKEPLIRLTLASIGFNVEDTSLEALGKLEALLDRFKEEGFDKIPITPVPFIIQFGKVLIDNIPGAHWLLDECEDISDIRVECPIGERSDARFELHPSARIMNYWRNEEESIELYGRLLVDIAHEKVDVKAMTEGEWERYDHGEMKKITIKPEDLDDELKLKRLSKALGRTITREELQEMFNQRKAQE